MFSSITLCKIVAQSSMLRPGDMCYFQVAVVVLAALGRFTLWGAVLVDTGAAIVVVLNGMRCLRWDIKTGSIWGFSRARKGNEERKDSSLQQHGGDGSEIASNSIGKTCSGCAKSCSTPAAS